MHSCLLLKTLIDHKTASEPVFHGPQVCEITAQNPYKEPEKAIVGDGGEDFGSAYAGAVRAVDPQPQNLKTLEPQSKP